MVPAPNFGNISANSQVDLYKSKSLKPQFKAKNQTPTPNFRKHKNMEYLVILNQRNLAFGDVNHDTLNDVVTENGELLLASVHKEKPDHHMDGTRAKHKKSFEAPHRVTERETLVPSKISFGKCDVAIKGRSRVHSLEHDKVIMTRSDLRKLRESLDV